MNEYIDATGSEIVTEEYLLAEGRPSEYVVTWDCSEHHVATVTWDGQPHAVYTRIDLATS